MTCRPDYFESLENRQMFAGSITLSGGVLTVIGNGRTEGEIIWVFVDDGRAAAFTADVPQKDFALNKVDRVVIKGMGGPDDILADLRSGIPITVSGGSGNDVINAGGSRIHGGSKVKLSGGPGNDLMNGGIGNDTLNGGKGNDILRDIYVAQDDNGNDIYRGGPGLDGFIGGGGTNDPHGLEITLDRKANDGVKFFNERDNVWDDIEAVEGGPWEDLIEGTAGAQTLYGMGGDDTLRGFGGNDVLFGDDSTTTFQPGFDKLFGGPGDDQLNGQEAKNFARRDTVDGGSGRDTLFSSTEEEEISIEVTRKPDGF